VDVESVRKEFYKKTGTSLKNVKNGEPVGTGRTEIANELYLMLALITHRDYFPSARAQVSVDMLTDGKAKDLFIALEECYREEKLSMDSLLEKIEDKELQNLVIEKASSAEFDLNTEKIISDSVGKIRKKSLEKRLLEIRQHIKRFDKTEPWKIKDLLVEQMVLDKEIEKLKVSEDARARK
jgi:DNA primase